MKPWTRVFTAAALFAGAWAPTAALAQLSNGGGPIDVTADQLEMVDSQHLAIWRGNVEAVQNGNRLVSDVLNVYFQGKSQPGAKAAAPPAPAGALGVNQDWGAVDHLVAEGHVFYVSPDQTARGDHAIYDMNPDTITMTGNVVVVQGQNVVKGDKLVVDVKTNHATIVSNTLGPNRPERVRGVFYNDSNSAALAQGGAKPAAGAGAAKAAPVKP